MKHRYTSVVLGFSLDNPQDISLPPSKCKSLELRSNCTSDCILDYALDIKPTTISFVTPSFLPFVLCPYRHRQLRCHNITCIPTFITFPVLQIDTCIMEGVGNNESVATNVRANVLASVGQLEQTEVKQSILPHLLLSLYWYMQTKPCTRLCCCCTCTDIACISKCLTTESSMSSWTVHLVCSFIIY